jgi:peptide/nickel transport system substrate-binding protein
MNHRNRTNGLTRRAVSKSAAAAAAYSLLPKFGISETFAAEPTHTMVVAAPATPQNLDHEFDVSLGTIAQPYQT